MDDRVICQCGKKYRVLQEAFGKRLVCRACGQEIEVDWDAKIAQPLLERIEAGEDPESVIASEAARHKGIEHDEKFMGVIGQEYFASNPGSMRVSFVRRFITYPLFPALLTACAATTWLQARLLNCYPVLSCVWVLFAIVAYLLRLKWKYKHSLILPGKIIAENPWRIAAVADMSSGLVDKEFNAIRVFEIPIRTYRGKLLVGERVVALANFMGGDEKLPFHHKDFFPEAVSCSVASMEEYERAMETLKEKDWVDLEKHVRLLPPDPPVGMYTFWDDNALGLEISKSFSSFAVGMIATWVLAILLAFADAGIFWLARKYWG